MTAISWTDADTARAMKIWEEYQQSHDLTDQYGQVAGIDPTSGRVWLDRSAKAIGARLQAVEIETQLFFIRVGFDHHVRKGGHR